MKGKEGITQSLDLKSVSWATTRTPPSCSCTLTFARALTPRPMSVRPCQGHCQRAAWGTLHQCPGSTWDVYAGPHPGRRIWLKPCRALGAHRDFTVTSSKVGKGQHCLFSWELSWRSRRCFQWRPTCIMLRTQRNHGFELQHWWLSFIQ